MMFSELKDKTIVHLTTAHSFDDVRIYHREAKLLSPYFKNVTICSSGEGELKDVNFISWGDKKPISRKDRMKSVDMVVKKIKNINADIIHFHDPELLLKISALKKNCKKLVYDVHEYYEGTLYDNSRGGLTGLILEYIYLFLEKRAMKFIDGIVTVTPQLCEHYRKYNKLLALVRNFPDSNRIIFKTKNKKIDISKHSLVFSGSLEQPSLYPLAKAIKLLLPKYKDIKVTLVGAFKDENEKKRIFDHWRENGTIGSLNYIERLKRDEFINILPTFSVGLVLFWPTRNARVALPNKLFEYMAVGLPVVVPDLPNQREVALKHKCGTVCDTTDPLSIANAIDAILSDEKKAENMGANGRRACIDEYNSEIEIGNLLELYEKLFKE